VPVFHVRRNTPQHEPDFNRTKALKWGEFTHPFLMMGMPDSPVKSRCMLPRSTTTTTLCT
jgi:hypothetical protein